LVRILVLIFLLIKLVPETIRFKKKVGLFSIPLFMSSRIRDPGLCYPRIRGFFTPRIRIRDDKFSDPFPG
jgi:hypothetical protein